MDEFQAVYVFLLGDTLGYLEAITPGEGIALPPSRAIISHQLRESVVENLRRCKKECVVLGLRMSVQGIDRMLELLQQPEFTRQQIKDMAGELRRRVEDEFSSTTLCMRIEPDKAELYHGKDLFGSQVSQQFPSAILEMEEAAKCLALGRATATVFHCMRILELGLNSLAKALNINSEHRNWEHVINDIEAAIKKISSDTGKPSDWKDRLHFYSEAALHFRFLKEAWRNYTMHNREWYTEESAITVFNHVKEFMKQLTIRLHE
jgi:HEPN domain-containing protein